MPPDPAHSRARDDAIDRELVRRVQEAGTIGGGDRDAWAALVTRYQDRLYGVCLRMVSDRETAADLTQEAFVKVIQGLESYDGRSAVSTWLIRVTMNVCLSYLRSQKLRRHASLDVPVLGVSSGGAAPTAAGARLADRRELSPDSGVQHLDQRRLVAAALASLDPDQRAILLLRDVQGLEYEQIAETLDIAVGTVKSRIFRARLALRGAVERMQGPADDTPGTRESKASQNKRK